MREAFCAKTLVISLKVGYNGLNSLKSIFRKEGELMHKYMRTIGFSQYTARPDMDKLLRKLSKDASRSDILKGTGKDTFCELRAETAPGMGVAIAGRLTERGTFKQEYYFPYVENTQITSRADCSIQRHTERETFAGLLDEYRVGISLIFYMENSMEYRLRTQERLPLLPKGAALSGLSVQGKILLPVQKTLKQTEDRKKAASKRSRLIEAAKRGDEDAIETLTVEDIDLFSSVSRRVAREDIYSIVETCFMPSGIECDQYAIIGNILSVDRRTNRITGEEILLLGLECNDLNFMIAVNSMDLIGEPAVGRRFKGQIWMQGNVAFD